MLCEQGAPDGDNISEGKIEQIVPVMYRQAEVNAQKVAEQFRTPKRIMPNAICAGLYLLLVVVLVVAAAPIFAALKGPARRHDGRPSADSLTKGGDATPASR